MYRDERWLLLQARFYTQSKECKCADTSGRSMLMTKLLLYFDDVAEDGNYCCQARKAIRQT
jgi:hypothetical protein